MDDDYAKTPSFRFIETHEKTIRLTQLSHVAVHEETSNPPYGSFQADPWTSAWLIL